MFARQVNMNLKPNSQARFTDTIEKEILPILRTQGGFKDEITLVSPDGGKAVAISLWEQKGNAEAYNSATYPRVLTALAGVVEGIPQVATYEVSNSTSHKIAAQVPA